MVQRWFWKLTTIWDPPPGVRYSRHAIVEIDSQTMAFTKVAKRTQKAAVRLPSERATKLEDFPFAFIPVMSARAVDVLSDLLEPDGEFVRAALYCRGKRLKAEYFVYNCLRLYDVVDLARIPELDRGIRNSLAGTLNMRLKYNAVPTGANAFRSKKVKDMLFVSERVAERLIESKLIGWMVTDPQGPPWRRKAIIGATPTVLNAPGWKKGVL